MRSGTQVSAEAPGVNYLTDKNFNGRRASPSGSRMITNAGSYGTYVKENALQVV
jgi:hypothetical protein